MEQKPKSKSNVKKGFFEVEAPMTAAKISLYGTSAEEFDGKVVILDLTKSLRGKSLELRMKIHHENGKLRAVPRSAKLAGSFIRRSMRRGSDYVEDSLEAKCRDAVVIIKPFLITRRRVSRSVRNVLRETAKKFLKSYLKIRDSREVFSDLMANKLQKGMASKLKKIYPLAMCEIRSFEIKGERPEGEVEDVGTEEDVLEDVEEEKEEGK